MQSIITRQLSPTNHNGDRIKAKQSYGKTSVTVGYNYALSNEQNHLAAAQALAEKLNWDGEFAGGSNGNDSWVFVNIRAAKSGRMTFRNTEKVPA